MTYTLAIGDRMYSSWSLRGWLMFEKFGIPVQTRLAPMASAGFAETLEDFGAARLVPALRFGDVVVWESLAIAQTLAERHPDVAFWPSDPVARGLARSLVAEMHAGFGALRAACAMNLWHAYAGFAASQAVRADLDRIAGLWALARAQAGDGPWLFGAYSLADAFYAPVAARIAGHGLEMPRLAADYVARHLADPAFRRWRAMGIAGGRVLARYDIPFDRLPWPGPAPLPARAVAGTPVNDRCPYSGDPVAADSIAEVAGVRIGFCNRFCRDKTVADAEAWPAAMAVIGAAR